MNEFLFWNFLQSKRWFFSFAKMFSIHFVNFILKHDIKAESKNK